MLDKPLVNELRGVDEVKQREMAWRLARKDGIFAGTLTGMNVVGALRRPRNWRGPPGGDRRRGQRA